METQIFHHAKYNLQEKNPLQETKILQNIITLELISSFNTSQNIVFQKCSYKNRPVIIIAQGPKSLKLLYSIMNLNTQYPCLGRQDQPIENRVWFTQSLEHIGAFCLLLSIQGEAFRLIICRDKLEAGGALGCIPQPVGPQIGRQENG